MERKQFLEAAKTQLESNIFNHSLALEACMTGLYDYFSSNNLLATGEPNREDWALAGLIHDIDYSGDTKDDHPNKTQEVLSKYQLTAPESVIQIIKAHSPKHTGVEPLSKAQWSIFCADSLTGLITAVAYVYPSRKLADVKVSSVVKRFLKEPKFAAGTRRDEVILCEREDGLNLKLDKFVEICLNSMQSISSTIGL